MNKVRIYIGAFFFIWDFYIMQFPVCAQEISQQAENGMDSQIFLDWYAEHKDTGGSFTLEGDLNLTTGTAENPILLDGIGRIDLYCNNYRLTVQSEVVIDNDNLIIFSQAEEAAVTLVDTDGTGRARLTLKNGYISSGGAVGLDFLSGELICPQGDDRFSIIAGGDSPRALIIRPQKMSLSNLKVFASGTGTVVGIAADGGLELQNCVVEVEESEEGSREVIGVKVESGLSVSGTTIIAKGSNARSVFCSAGIDQVEVDGSCTLEPEIEIPPENGIQYRVTGIENPSAFNVPFGISQDVLELPGELECQLSYLNDGTTPVTSCLLSVDWDIENMETRLQQEGELTISGSFNEQQLKEKKIYPQQSIQPSVTVRVLSTTAMNRIWFSKIEPTQSPPVVEIYMQTPYKAESLFIEYSSDGINWEKGYCIRTADTIKDPNILNYDHEPSVTLTVPVYLREIAYGARVRAVVAGGPFAGTWAPVLLDPDNLFIKPGEDGKGGDRGGTIIVEKPASETEEDIVGADPEGPQKNDQNNYAAGNGQLTEVQIPQEEKNSPLIGETTKAKRFSLGSFDIDDVDQKSDTESAAVSSKKDSKRPNVGIVIAVVFWSALVIGVAGRVLKKVL